MDTPTINENYCKFSDSAGHNIVENDGNYILDDYPIIWTNFAAYTTIYVKMAAFYTQPADSRDAQHYVKDFRVGVIEEKTILSYYKCMYRCYKNVMLAQDLSFITIFQMRFI